MKRIVLFVTLAVAMAATGYTLGKVLLPSKASQTKNSMAVGEDLLYKLPLGRFTVQVIKPSQFVNIRFVMDVYIDGAQNFERMNGGISRSRMREDVLRHMSNMAETTLWSEGTTTDALVPETLAFNIASKLYHRYPMIRTARISEFATSEVER